MLRILLLTACLAGILPAPLHAQHSIGLRSGAANVHRGLRSLTEGFQVGERRQPYSWVNELYYEYWLRSGWSFGAGIVYNTRSETTVTSAWQPAAWSTESSTRVTQLQITALYDWMRIFREKSRLQLNLGFSASPALFSTHTEIQHGSLQPARYKASEYGFYSGLLFQPAFRLTKNFTLTANIQLQELVAQGWAPYGYNEMTFYSGRHSYGLGLAYKFQ